MPKTCDNASVGILIVNDHGQFLMFDRNTAPAGVAPSAGHVFDDHDSYEKAARAEVSEELGLTVETLELMPAGGWRNNRCRREPGQRGIGHQWQIFRATVSGELNASQRETRNVRWLTADDLQALADRTIDYAHGNITDDEFVTSPGIEPVWVRFLTELGEITASPRDLDLIERVAEQGTNAVTYTHPDVFTVGRADGWAVPEYRGIRGCRSNREVSKGSTESLLTSVSL